MQRFIFSLEKVHTLRTYREQEARNALGAAVSALSAIEDQLAALRQEREAARADLSACEHPGAGELFTFERYCARLACTEANLEAARSRAEAQVIEARARYLAASQDRKALDIVQDTQRQAYRKALLQEDIKITDDAVRRRRS